MTNVVSPQVGENVRVAIEVARWSPIKRRPDGSVDFVSLPCPYNYGSVVGTMGADGDPLDAVVLGPRLGYGQCIDVQVRGCIDFVDASLADPKWICSDEPLTEAQRRGIVRFFEGYVRFKRLLYRLRRNPQGAQTYVRGWSQR